MQLDHLAITAASLEEGVAWAEERLGVKLDPGGRHERFGTHNRLLSLGPGLYLEVIAPEPGTAPGMPRWFGLDQPGAPRLGNWIVRVPDLAAALAAAPPEVGEALPLSRGDLSWTVTVPPDGSMPWGGAYPTLIQWSPGHHPADRLSDKGVRLVALEVGHPRAPRLRELLPGLTDPRISFVTADEPGLRARFSGPEGEVTL
ncbi:VOC family protein [Rubellimicrobium arenae]|uniref:VOC family protein n=1 Tax=Rubellimicrobium arenae TaxID=2817372 RepID=UPI001B312400|nr:VOC family protein [Rubellimicrobium arenae]